MKQLVLLLCFSLLLIASCKKITDPKYTYTGKLFYSTSNPTPVSNFKISIYRKEESGLLSWSPGVFEETKTDKNGNFIISYFPIEGRTILGPQYSSAPLVLIASDSINNQSVYKQWYNIPALKDTSMSNIYLF